MKLILHYTPSSPFCRFVLMTAIHKKLQLLLYISNPLSLDNQRIEFVNALRQIPVLEVHAHNSCMNLTHSMLICEYLDSLSPNNKVSIVDDFRFRDTYYRIYGITERVLSLMYETKRAPELQSKENTEKLKRIINMSLNNIEKELEMHPIKDINLFTITLSALLGYLDFRLNKEVDWRENRPKLNDWFIEFQKQAVFQKTLSFEFIDLKQGAIYDYQHDLEVDRSLMPLDRFLQRSTIIDHHANIKDFPAYNS